MKVLSLAILALSVLLMSSCEKPKAPAPTPQPAPPALPQSPGASILLPAVSGKLFGYVDTKGVFKIRPQFTGARTFSKDLAAVSVGGSNINVLSPIQAFLSDPAGRVGYIDSTGHFAINPIYYCARDFSEDDIAVVAKAMIDTPLGKQCSQWQAIDRQGNALFPQDFSQAGNFHDGLMPAAIVETITMSSAKTSQDCTSDYARRLETCVSQKHAEPLSVEVQKYGAVDKSGAWKIPPKYDFIRDFREGMSFAYKGCTAAMINTTGNEHTPFSYDACRVRPGPFSEGLAAAAPAQPAGSSKADQTRSRVGYIDKTGEFVIKPQFDSARRFSKKLAAVRAGTLWGYIDEKGMLSINPAFKEVSSFFLDHHALVCTADDVIAVIADNGDTIKKTGLSCDYSNSDNVEEQSGRFPVERGQYYFARDAKNGAQLWLQSDGKEIYREDVGAPGSNTNSAAPVKTGSSGTAFVVSADGYWITAGHVVKGCTHVSVPNKKLTLDVVKVDVANDLALLKGAIPLETIPSVAKADEIVLGMEAVIFGYPLAGIVSSTGNITTGVVSGLTGIQEDSRFFQLSAPLQPGNSGGPIVDRYGKIIGVAIATLDPRIEMAVEGALPQNVNFAIGPNMIRQFLTVQGVHFREPPRWPEWKQDTDALAAEAAKYSYQIICRPETKSPESQ